MINLLVQTSIGSKRAKKKLTCNGDNTILLFQINKIMIHEKVILHIIMLLVENNKKCYLRYMRVKEMYEMKHELHD